MGSPCDEHAAAEKRVVVSIPFARCRVVPFSALGFDYRFAQSVLVTPPLRSLKWIQSVYTQTRWAPLGLMRYTQCAIGADSRAGTCHQGRSYGFQHASDQEAVLRERAALLDSTDPAIRHRRHGRRAHTVLLAVHSAVRSAFGTVSASAPSSIGASCACPKLGKPGMHCAVASEDHLPAQLVDEGYLFSTV